VDVWTDATLMGTGTVNGDVVAATGSAIEPGQSIGTLIVDGNVTLDGTLTVQYDGGASPAIDVLSVSGSLNLDGGTFDFSGVGDPLTEPSYVFVTFNPGGRTGTAAESNVPTGYQVVYDDDAGTIALVPEPSTIILLLLAGLTLAAWKRR